jgi:peptide/nickel transport system substrate-binding protein
MRKFLRLAPLALAAALALTPITGTRTTVAQSDNFIIDGTFGKGPETFNPILCNDAECLDAIASVYPQLVATNPATQKTEKGAKGGLAKDWKVSADGLVWTIMLRNDYKWGDGTPVTTKDVMYAYNAILDPAVESPNSTIREDVESVKAIDDYTLEIKLKRPECDSAFQKIGGVIGTGGVPPSHLYPKDLSKLKDSDVNVKPPSFTAQYKFDEFRTAELVRFTSNQAYPDKQGAKIEHDGKVVRIVENQTALIQQFLAGTIQIIEEPPVSRRKDILDAQAKGTVKTFTKPGTLWDHIVLNHADPADPQSAYELDKDGKPLLDKPIKQKPHPVFGDVKVRRAFQLGLDMKEIIEKAVFGYGKQMTSLLTPGNIYYDKSLAAVPYDPAAAEKLLDEAGWKKGADGIREKDGKKLKFTLTTIQGNVRRTAVANVAKDQLKKIGFDVVVETKDFNKMLDDLDAQTFDAVISARGSVYDNSIDWTFLFDPATDVVGTGSNTGSYINPKVTELMKEVSAVKGCDEKRTAELWKEIQKTLQDDQPYIFLYTQDYMFAWNSKIEGVKPFELSFGYTDTWKVVNK